MTAPRSDIAYPSSGTRHPVPDLLATYRVQLNTDFTLGDAIAVVPYLEKLGISHLYCSPVLKARRGSRHGYDVADPAQVNPEIGTVDELRQLADALHERGMGILLDIVPNHMGIGPDNPYWEDVLTHGMQSRYAHWFDIDWDAGQHRVVLPVLGDEVETVIGRGELSLDVSGRTPRLRYHESSWPLDPASLPGELELAELDPTAVGDPSELLRGKEGRARLHALLDAQHYRLAFWRHAPREINYRRFFDVNELIALRQEDPRVFAETHAFVLSLVQEGVIDGLRVDHVDGLADPLGYLEALRREVDARVGRGQRGPGVGRSNTEWPGQFPIVVEKILSPGEQLRDSWPVQGTTGYEFLNDLEDVFLDAGGYAAVEREYRQLRRLTKGDFGDVAYEGKVKILTGSLQADVARLARLLAPLLRDDAGTPAPGELVDGIVQFVAALPVYRTYIDGRTPALHPDDVALIERAVALARARLGGSPVVAQVKAIADLLCRVPAADAPERGAWLEFVQRLQQTSGPATAKGVEDTALYIYVPLASRNEVGGAPDRPLNDAVGRLHDANALRARQWPSALLCTNTHDTKRSADLRARLDVLTECPRDWHLQVRRWRRLNQKHRRVVRGRMAPDTNAEYILYQTLIGIWPAPRAGRRVDDLPDRGWRDAARERLDRYMLKAVREAKIRTSWTDPDPEYEKALSAFIGAILEPGDEAPFLMDVARFVAQIAPRGYWNALSRALVHLTSPGTPDLYRGDELWFLALVDPDNRQPVDFDQRRKALDEITDGTFAVGRGEGGGNAVDPTDPRLKLLVIQRVLAARRAHAALFTRGDYRPLEVRGSCARHLTAFVRTHEGQHALVLAPRLLGSLHLADDVGRWGDTEVVLPDGAGEGEGEGEGKGLAEGVWRSALDGRQIPTGPERSRALTVSSALEALPLALLLSP